MFCKDGASRPRTKPPKFITFCDLHYFCIGYVVPYVQYDSREEGTFVNGQPTPLPAWSIPAIDSFIPASYTRFTFFFFGQLLECPPDQQSLTVAFIYCTYLSILRTDNNNSSCQPTTTTNKQQQQQLSTTANHIYTTDPKIPIPR